MEKMRTSLIIIAMVITLTIFIILLCFCRSVKDYYLDTRETSNNTGNSHAPPTIPEWEKWEDADTGQCTIPPPQKESHKGKMRPPRVAFCFLISDILDWAPIWDIYFSAEPDTPIYVHRSHPSSDDIGLSVPYTVIPTEWSEWAKIYDPQKEIVRTALLDTEMEAMVWISAHCAPVKTLEEFKSTLYPDPSVSIQMFAKKSRNKAATWGVWSRELAQTFLDTELTEYMPDYPMETYRTNDPIIAYKGLHGGLDEFTIPQLLHHFPHLKARHTISTFVCWDPETMEKHDPSHIGTGGPVNFETISASFLRRLREATDVSFVRKLLPTPDNMENIKIVLSEPSPIDS